MSGAISPNPQLIYFHDVHQDNFSFNSVHLRVKLFKAVENTASVRICVLVHEPTVEDYTS